MTENQAWVTALITAYARAYHATHDSPKIFDDFLADQFFTPGEHVSFDKSLAGMLKQIDPNLAATRPDQATALACVMQTMHEPVTLSRSRFCEDRLEDEVNQGTTQYVILGAGFDTFAFRRPDLLARLRVFELDHPSTQEKKRERIAYAGWTIPEQLTFIPVDFNQKNLAEALLQSSFDPTQLSFISWLGVTYYLPKEVVFNSLRLMHSIAPRGSNIVFDYMDVDSFNPEKAAHRTAFMHEIARLVGEPMLSGFDPLTLADELRPFGLDLVENPGPKELELLYFQGRTDRLHAFEHVHIARAVCL